MNIIKPSNTKNLNNAYDRISLDNIDFACAFTYNNPGIAPLGVKGTDDGTLIFFEYDEQILNDAEEWKSGKYKVDPCGYFVHCQEFMVDIGRSLRSNDYIEDTV